MPTLGCKAREEYCFGQFAGTGVRASGFGAVEGLGFGALEGLGFGGTGFGV